MNRFLLQHTVLWRHNLELQAVCNTVLLKRVSKNKYINKHFNKIRYYIDLISSKLQLNKFGFSFLNSTLLVFWGSVRLVYLSMIIFAVNDSLRQAPERGNYNSRIFKIKYLLDILAYLLIIIYGHHWLKKCTIRVNRKLLKIIMKI